MTTSDPTGVFISYRRSVHADLARTLYLELTARGYNVFYDMECVDHGRLEEVILPQIRQRTHFIFLVARGTLDRCRDPEDWVRREFDVAGDVRGERNIVPVLDGMTIAEIRPLLSGSLISLPEWNAIPYNRDFHKASIDRICDALPKDMVISTDEEPAIATPGAVKDVSRLVEADENLSRLVEGSPKVISGYVNCLEMRFLAFPQSASSLICQTQTTLGAYLNFVKDTGREYQAPSFEQTPEDPVVQVTWEDAGAFCEWLTQKDRRRRRGIGRNDRYRLPTDHEWSLAVGIGELEDPELSPDAKNGKIEGIFPWGPDRKPPALAGNYAQPLGIDSYPYTSPVGSFAPNPYELLDMGGNVWEWCADWYIPGKSRVIRGGSYQTLELSDLLSSHRNRRLAGSKHPDLGFRCVLEVDSSTS